MPEATGKKHGGGPKPYRTFYTSIGFRISPELHEQMKTEKASLKIRMEDVYREAALLLLELRERKPLIYLAAPRTQASRAINVKMENGLKARIQLATDADDHTRSDFFETAARLYLESRRRVGLDKRQKRER
jgi:hypothetical protein